MQVEKLDNVLLDEQIVDIKDLILYNDDVNTFDYVAELLMKYCDHQPLQAEQCAWIVHHNGKCQIKRGEFKALKPICQALLDGGLSAIIE